MNLTKCFNNREHLIIYSFYFESCTTINNNTENYSKKTGFRSNKSRHCAFIIYSVKTRFFKRDMLSKLNVDRIELFPARVEFELYEIKLITKKPILSQLKVELIELLFSIRRQVHLVLLWKIMLFYEIKLFSTELIIFDKHKSVICWHEKFGLTRN